MEAENQIDRLRDVATNNRWAVTTTFSDRSMPIKKGRERRPGEDGLLAVIRRGEVQKVLVWSIDRVGRSLVELVAFIETCRIAGVGLGYDDVAVLIEGVSVVVRTERLLEAWHQNWDAFVQSVPNRTLCADGELPRVGWMTPDDAKLYIDALRARGLIYLGSDGEARDIIVVDQIRGPAAPCGWVVFGHVNLNGDHRHRIAACQLAGSSNRQVCTPDGWTFEESLSASFGFVPTGEEPKSLVFIRRQNGLDVYLNRVTGKEVFVAKTRLGGDGP